ncbi:MAG: S1 RNA-binding domain-containing protein [bacterium]
MFDEDKNQEQEAEEPAETGKSEDPTPESQPDMGAETASQPEPETELDLVAATTPAPEPEPLSAPEPASTEQTTLPPAPRTAEVEPTMSPVDDSDTESESNAFAAMLAASENQTMDEPSAGDKISGTIIQIGEKDSFVDCGTRSELAIATAELKDQEDNLQHQVGDTITAHVLDRDGELRLTFALDLRDASLEAIQQAYQGGTPLTGTVKETNKGGFTVDLGGKRAFCPYSQIDLRRVEDPETFVNQSYEFRIIELSEDGRNVVVSRRALLQEHRDELAGKTRESLELGDVCSGVVTRLVPFGAFVDIGGVEGLVHISQISHQRIPDPGSVLKVGEKVQVKVLEIQNLGQGRRERISLSIKVLLEDPWPVTAKSLQIGTDVQGRVTRLADFGAFIELHPGVEGLIHISELAPHRIFHPQEVVAVDEEVTVRILDVDLNRRRISLSLKGNEATEE